MTIEATFLARAKTASHGARAFARSTRARAAAVIAIYLLLSGAAVAWGLLELRNQTIAGAGRLMGPLAQLAAEQTGRTMTEVDWSLRDASRALERLKDGGAAGDQQKVRAALREGLANRDFLRAIFVVDIDGRVAFTSDDSVVGTDLSDRPYVRHHRERTGREFFVGGAVRSRTKGEWVVPAARALRGAGGEMTGVLAATVDPGYFSRVWTIDDANRVSVALFRTDGALLARSPHVEAMMGASFAGMPLFAEQLNRNAKAGSYTTDSAIDGAPRLLAYRAVDAYPQLLVVVGQTMSEILRPWRIYALWTVAVWVLGSTALSGLILWLERAWSSRSRAERALKVSRDRLSAILDHAIDAVIMIDHRDVVEYFSAAAERMFGYAAAEVAGRDAHMLLPPRYKSEHLEGIGAYLAAAQAKRLGVGREVHGLHKDGSVFPMDLAVGEMPANGGVRQFVGTMRDTTARRETEDQLRQAQKMETLGQLTGGVAHDFNNMLTVIVGNAEILVDEVQEPRLRRVCEQILLAAEGSADLTSRLLAFARKQALQPKRVSVAPFMARIETLLRRTLGENVDVRTNLKDGLWEVTIDPSQLEAAIMNLAINARDAMPAGGRLTIDSSNWHIDSDYVAENPGAVAGDYVMISVSDDGVGMNAETVKRAFEPFFTTKDVGKGTGLGLSMVYGFVRQSDGHVKVHSELGHGTSVRLYLPRATGADTETAAKAPQPKPSAAKGERILVVEDEDLVRAYVSSQLKGLGYAVIEAANGPEAVAILSGDAVVDLLFTDVIMPGGMSGRDVGARARALRPGIPILYTSGYPQDAFSGKGRIEPGVNLLSKPYRLHELAAKLREALDTPGLARRLPPTPA